MKLVYLSMKGEELMKEIKLKVNGLEQVVSADPHDTLGRVLREKLYLTGLHLGCEGGDCGACTVLVNGIAVVSCLFPVMKAVDKEIETIEGLAPAETLHPIQESMIEHGAIQCGFCSPGVVMNAKALLSENSAPTEEEVRKMLTGNVCRCTGYQQIVDAILDVSSDTSKERG